MPSVYMHMAITYEVAKETRKPLKQEAAYLGSLGPNPYRYYVVSEEHSAATMLARKLHETRVQAQLVSLINAVKKEYSEARYGFLIGYLAHAALDMHVNPYILYYTGYYKTDTVASEAFLRRHHRFEEAIDAAFKAVDDTFDSESLLRMGFPFKKVPFETTLLMSDICANVYSEARGGVLYNRGYQWMRRYYKAGKSHNILKRGLIRVVDTLKKKKDIEFAAIHTQEDFPDALNLKRAVWYHPVTEEPSTKSVLDLYEDALGEMILWVEAIEAYMHDDAPVDFNRLFKDRSLNFGVSIAQVEAKNDFRFHPKIGQVFK